MASSISQGGVPATLHGNGVDSQPLPKQNASPDALTDSTEASGSTQRSDATKQAPSASSPECADREVQSWVAPNHSLPVSGDSSIPHSGPDVNEVSDLDVSEAAPAPPNVAVVLGQLSGLDTNRLGLIVHATQRIIAARPDNEVNRPDIDEVSGPNDNETSGLDVSEASSPSGQLSGPDANPLALVVHCGQSTAASSPGINTDEGRLIPWRPPRRPSILDRKVTVWCILAVLAALYFSSSVVVQLVEDGLAGNGRVEVTTTIDTATPTPTHSDREPIQYHFRHQLLFRGRQLQHKAEVGASSLSSCLDGPFSMAEIGSELKGELDRLRKSGEKMPEMTEKLKDGARRIDSQVSHGTIAELWAIDQLLEISQQPLRWCVPSFQPSKRESTSGKLYDDNQMGYQDWRTAHGKCVLMGRYCWTRIPDVYEISKERISTALGILGKAIRLRHEMTGKKVAQEPPLQATSDEMPDLDWTPITTSLEDFCALYTLSMQSAPRAKEMITHQFDEERQRKTDVKARDSNEQRLALMDPGNHKGLQSRIDTLTSSADLLCAEAEGSFKTMQFLQRHADADLKLIQEWRKWLNGILASIEGGINVSQADQVDTTVKMVMTKLRNEILQKYVDETAAPDMGSP